MPPAELRALRTQTHQQLERVLIALCDDSEFEQQDLVALRQNMLAIAAMQTVLGTLHWTSSLAPVVKAIEMLEETYTPGGPPLSPVHDEDAAEYAQAAKNAVTSIFEVLEVEEGKSLLLRDVFDGREYLAHERAGSTGMPTRTLLLGRLVLYREIYVIEGMLPRVAPPSLRTSLVARIQATCPVPATPAPRSRGWAYAAMLVWHEVLEEDAQRRMYARPPTLLTTTGERVAPSRAVFAFAEEDRERILDALDRLRGCFPDEADTESDTTTFTLFQREVIEGRIHLGASTLIIETNAAERLTRIRNRIQKKIPGILTLLDRETISVESLLESASPSASEPPPPEARALLSAFIAHRYESFLDEPLPALDGLSPRSAAQRDGMHDQLDALLREHEFSVTQQFGAGVVDFAAMRRALKMPR